MVKNMKIQELSTSEKVILAQELWDSVILNQQALNVTQDQTKELDKRLAQFEMDGELGLPWELVKSRLLKS